MAPGSRTESRSTPKTAPKTTRVRRDALEMQLLAKQVGRKAQKGVEPNDRRHDRDAERKARRMRPEQLDELLRGEE